jgi:hypothetical protein
MDGGGLGKIAMEDGNEKGRRAGEDGNVHALRLALNLMNPWSVCNFMTDHPHRTSNAASENLDRLCLRRRTGRCDGRGMDEKGSKCEATVGPLWFAEFAQHRINGVKCCVNLLSDLMVS